MSILMKRTGLLYNTLYEMVFIIDRIKQISVVSFVSFVELTLLSSFGGRSSFHRQVS